MKIISFCLFFNPGATTLIVYIESNSHVTQEILCGPGPGNYVLSRSVAIVLPVICHRNSSKCTLSVNPGNEQCQEKKP